MTISPRTQSLVDRLRDSKHPQTATMRAVMAQCLGAAERFAERRAAIASDGKLTSTGKAHAIRNALPGFIRDLTRARAPIDRALSDIKMRRGALRIEDPDPTNLAGAIERMEIRTWLRGLDDLQRQAVTRTTNDPRILEAALSAPPELSGITNSLADYGEEIENRYLSMQYGAEMADIAELEKLVEEAAAAAIIARNDLRNAAGMNERDFETLASPIEQRAGAPWLMKNRRGFGANATEYVQVVEVDLATKTASYREATPQDIVCGIFYADFAAYEQAQAGGAAVG